MKKTREYRRHDLTGQKFGKLLVLKRGENDKYGRTTWICQCDCGNIKTIAANNLRRGVSKSCGCETRKSNSWRMKTHGMSGTRLYKIWSGIKYRCNSPNSTSYKNYGGRGIAVCKEWETFKPFYDWSIENGYNDMLTIDRINPDGDYEPENCRWATYKEQAINKRNTKFYALNGELHTLSEWEDILGIDQDTLWRRIHASHWSVEKALTTPLLDTKHKER